MGEIRPPDWIGNHRTDEETTLHKLKEERSNELEKINQRLRHLAEVRSSLHTTGKQLEKAVTMIFSDLGWKFEDLTARREAIDYMIRGSDRKRSLIVALTGTDGYVSANHKKIAQLFGAIPTVKDNQRLVFLVNAFAEEDPRSRSGKKGITDAALKRLEMNQVCVLFVHDLYKLWLDHKERGLSSEKIFDLLYDTSKLFEHTSRALPRTLRKTR